MSATVIGSAVAAMTTAATVVVATMPEARDVLLPILDGGEYGIVSASILASLPVLAVMTVLAGSGRE